MTAPRCLAICALAFALGGLEVACAPAPSAPPVLSIGPAAAVAEEADPASVTPRARLSAAQAERAAQLLKALQQAGHNDRPRLLSEMRGEVGGAGLVMALDTVPREPEEQRWFVTQVLLTMVRDLADPDAVDALAAWASRPDRHGHWRGVVGAALAEVGDLRAVPLLAARLRQPSDSLYQREKFWQADEGGHLLRSDRQRTVAARLLGDLALMHPSRVAELRAEAGEAVAQWLLERPQPHANGLRFLAASESVDRVGDLRAWAFPTEPLPAVGAAPPFPMAYETAQVGLRYLGWMRDRPSLDGLLQQFRRKDPGLDISQQALMSTGVAMRGMALRAVAYGAAQGLSQWGSDVGQGAVDALVTLIEDETWYEEARLEACAALPWIASPTWLATLSSRVKRFGAQSAPQAQFVASCYAEALARSSLPQVTVELTELMKAPIPVELRYAVARALGRASIPANGAAATALREMLGVGELKGPATLALLLGGSSDQAVAALQRLPAQIDDPLHGELADAYYQSLGYVSTRDLRDGALERWVENARAAHAGGSRWVLERLRQQLDNLLYDNGPHSLTRPVLRFELTRAARSGALPRRRGAIAVLVTLREQGVLMALARDRDEHAALAVEALHELHGGAAGPR